jgi:hypothetical protein
MKKPNPTMYYKYPGAHQLEDEDGKYDYTVIDGDDDEAVKEAQSQGWHKSMAKAKAAGEKEAAEKEAKAKGDTKR